MRSRSRLATLAAVTLAVVTLAVGTAPAQERCFVQVRGPSRAVVQQPVFFEVVVGWDREWFEAHAVALSRQPTDAPLHLDVPWLRAPDGYAATVAPPRAPGAPCTVAVGDRVVVAARLADAERDGRAFARLAVRVRLMPTRAGALDLEPARVRYAYATAFRDHLLRGREPLDRQEAATSSARGALQVRRLAGDAPGDFSGAVGAFDVAWLSGGQQVAVGQPFSVEMTVLGGEETNLEQIRAPSPGVLDGFHVQGVIEAPADQGRRFVLELVPLRAGVAAVEGLSFVSYAPDSDAFVRVDAGPVPVRVVPRLPGVELPPGIEQLIEQDARAQGAGASLLRWLFVGLAVLGLAMFRFDRGRRRRGALEHAMAGLRDACAAEDAPATARAFEQLIARVGGGETFASPISWQSLAQRGVAPEGLARLKELHAALDQARFGGPAPDRGDVLAAAETLFQAAKG